MKSFFVNAIAKKTMMLLLVLAIAAGVAFAAPLTAGSGFGDAKVYDSSYKSVTNPTEVSDGFVLKTASQKVVLNGESLEVEVEGNSLLQFISLGDGAVFYLLDGRAIFTSASAFEVKTTVTTYKVQADSSIYVITDDAEETAYVSKGSAEATNLITGEVTQIDAGKFIDNSKRGFQPSDTTRDDYWEKSTAEEAVEEIPASQAEETTVAETSEAVTEEVAQTDTAEAVPQEPEQEEKPVETPVAPEVVVTESGALEHTFEYRGFKAVLRAYIGVADLEYPAFVTNEEIDAAARAAVITFPQFVEGISYEVVEPGLAKIYYPESYGITEFEFAVYLIEQELSGYLDALLGLEPEQKLEEEPKAEAKPVAEPVAEQVVEEPAVYGALVKEFSHRGIEARIEAYIGECFIYYPTFVTNDEIDAAAAAAVWKYPQYTQGITYEIVEPGFAKAYYPTTYGPDEFYFAMGLLESELYAYIDELFATTEPEQELVAELPAEEPVAEQPAEEPAAEQPAEPEKTPIETTPRAEEPVEEPAEEPAEKKESEFKFGASVQFIYGNGSYSDDYKSPAKIDYRTGVFYNSFSVVIDPTISYKNFKFGLHLVADVRSGKFVNPFVFQGGVTGIVNTAMRFVSVLNYTNGNFQINVDRTSELEFKSPIFSELRRAYDTQDKLLATMKFETSEFGFTAFVDDLQLENKLLDRSQFAGARAFFKVGKMQIGLSVIADFKNGFQNIVFYPGGDATLPFTIKGIDFELSGGAVASFKKTGKAAMIEGQFKKTSGLIIFGLGGAYSVRYHFNDLINNGPTDVVTMFKGKSIDVIGSLGVNTKIFKLVGSFTLPLSLKKNDGNTLVYQTVKTKRNETAYITADTFSLQADLAISKFTFSAGAVYNGLVGRLSDFVKAVMKKEGYDLRERFAALVDPEISTVYALASIGIDIGPGTLDAYIRADLVRLQNDTPKDNALTMPVSAGIKYSF